MADDLWAASDLVTPMAIRVAATLRLADHIAAGTGTAAALAAAAGADPDTLVRLLEHLVTAGVLIRSAEGFALTGLGSQLRDEQGVRQWLDLEGAVGRADLSLTQMLHTVRTGEAGYVLEFGRPFWDDVTADPARSASFDALMSGRMTAELPAIAEAYPWGALGHVVDVGGGDGSLVIALLRAHPELRGTVVELPTAAGRASSAFARAGVSDRGAAVAGSFFDPLPAGAGGYLLSGVLHDWDDERAGLILRRCAEALAPDGRVFVIEEAENTTDSDLRMLCYCGGRERSLDQLDAIAAPVGLTVGPVAFAGIRRIVELRPSP